MNQKQSPRFSPVELVIIAVSLIVIAIGGYKIYTTQRGTSHKPDAMKTSDTGTQDIAQTTNWLEVKSASGGFSMKIPNGWDVTSYPASGDATDQLAAQNPVYNADKQATIATAQDGSPSNEARFTVVLRNGSINTPANAADAATTTKTVTRGGLTGKQTKITWSGSAAKPHQIDYVYTFALPHNRTLIATYKTYDGTTNNLSQFEQAIQTIKIN